MKLTCLLALTVGTLLTGSVALAQQPVSADQVPQAVKDQQAAQQAAREAAQRAAMEAANKPRPAPVITSTNATVLALDALLTGTFKSEPSADGKTPALIFASAVVNVEGLDNAVYFEVFRADSPAAPFSSGLLHVWMKKGQPVLRQYSFLAQNTDFARAVAGMWMAPEIFPLLKADRLVPAIDVPLTPGDHGDYMGHAQAPTALAGAHEFDARWSVGRDNISFVDRGYDTDGNVVWGPAADAASQSFTRTQLPTAVERRGGVVIYDLVVSPSNDMKLVTGNEAYAHATAWSIEGVEAYNSRTMPRDGGPIQPFRMMIPGGMPAGFQTGIEGLAVGTVRRMYLPAALAWGARPPRPLAKLGANMDSVWQLETIYVGAAPEADLPKPPAPAPGVSTAPVGPIAPAAPPVPVVAPK